MPCCRRNTCCSRRRCCTRRRCCPVRVRFADSNPCGNAQVLVSNTSCTGRVALPDANCATLIGDQGIVGCCCSPTWCIQSSGTRPISNGTQTGQFYDISCVGGSPASTTFSTSTQDSCNVPPFNPDTIGYFYSNGSQGTCVIVSNPDATPFGSQQDLDNQLGKFYCQCNNTIQ